MDHGKHAGCSGVRTEQTERLEIEPVEAVELRVQAALRAFDEHLDDDLLVVAGCVSSEQGREPTGDHAPRLCVPDEQLPVAR